MKHFTLASLLAAAMVFCATATAFARDGCSADLTPPDKSDEPGASGVAKVAGVQLRHTPWGDGYVGKLTITCSGLTPGSTYSTNVGRFVADARGTGRVGGSLWLAPNSYYVIIVERMDPSPYVVVLQGLCIPCGEVKSRGPGGASRSQRWAWGVVCRPSHALRPSGRATRPDFAGVRGEAWPSCLRPNGKPGNSCGPTLSRR